jgi:hypothetical protein
MPTCMLARSLDEVTRINYADYVWSPKIDGFRAHSGALTRSMKYIANRHTRLMLESIVDFSLDGELIVGSDPTLPGLFNLCQSAFTSYEGEPDFTYHVFDTTHDLITHKPYSDRLGYLESIRGELPDWVRIVEHDFKLDDYDRMLDGGYEGIMGNNLTLPYKWGRSGVVNPHLVRVKPWVTSEATVVGYGESLVNCNPQFYSESGHLKRSYNKEGMVPGGKLGYLIVLDSGVEFNLSLGCMTHDERERLWSIRDSLIGRVCTYKKLAYGELNKPRLNGFVGWRHSTDIV